MHFIYAIPCFKKKQTRIQQEERLAKKTEKKPIARKQEMEPEKSEIEPQKNREEIF